MTLWQNYRLDGTFEAPTEQIVAQFRVSDWWTADLDLDSAVRGFLTDIDGPIDAVWDDEADLAEICAQARAARVVVLGQRVADRGELVLWSPAVVVLRSDANGSRRSGRTRCRGSGWRSSPEALLAGPGRKTIAPSALSREDKQHRRTARQQPRNRGGLIPRTGSKTSAVHHGLPA